MTNEDEARLAAASAHPSAIARLKQMFADAVARGDGNLSTEIRGYLARHGIEPDEPAAPAEEEKAVPAKAEKAVKKAAK